MASYEMIKNTLPFDLSFSPTSAFPIDARSMFGSYEAAAIAAASAEPAGSTNTVYYIGQDITVFENDKVTKYVITADKTLESVGSEIIGDDKTIAIGENGTISLKSFGVEYYKYNNADNILPAGEYSYPDNMPTDANTNDFVQISDTYYQFVDSTWVLATETPKTEPYYTLTTGWKGGLEPKVLYKDGNYELAWYEPSATTIEGVQSIVAGLQTAVDELTQTVDDNKTELQEAINTETDRATAAEELLRSDITKNTQDIATLNGGTDVEGSVDAKIAAAVAAIMENPDETMNSIKELVDWVNNHGDAVEIQNDIAANTEAINDIKTLLGDALPENATSTDVISYIAEVVNTEKTRAETAENKLTQDLGNIKAITDNLGTAATMDADEFATAEQGALAETAVQSVTKGENGHIIVVDGDEEGVDVEVYKAPVASVTQLGDVKVDGASISTTEDGVISVAAVDVSKVTNLDTKLTETKDNAVDEAKEYTDTNAVLVENIVDTTNVAASSAEASAKKVVSEELLLKALEWKYGM